LFTAIEYRTELKRRSGRQKKAIKLSNKIAITLPMRRATKDLWWHTCDICMDVCMPFDFCCSRVIESASANMSFMIKISIEVLGTLTALLLLYFGSEPV